MNQVVKNIKEWQRDGLKVVLVTGVFDLLHIEHIRFLQKAKNAGDKLLVGIESDERVKKIKGHTRPLNPQVVRVEQLMAVKPVDAVFVLPENFDTQNDWEQLMKKVKPDLYAVSSHTSYLENKKAICQKFDIEFQIVHPFNDAYSTTLLHEKLQQLEVLE